MQAIRNRLYYRIKPFLSSASRLTARRWYARWKRDRVGDVWPILPGSERPPAGWPGWPGGKQFALVLTHDVEGQAGLEKCRRVMELEEQYGFRSSFNFIPEGEYRSAQEFRQELTERGFEVGVHDLYHDGMLYSSREGFAEKAVKINEHLKNWGAVGFRSGFMLHNLDWIGDLRIQYDASTFDTDPFEPQPDGVGTIFPFWVPARTSPSRKSEVQGSTPQTQQSPGGLLPPSSVEGYAELPYTLVQDSTLFLLLGERSPDLWLQKLNWVARQGGMVLVNVHPDYLRFADEQPSLSTFPAEIYAQLLEYARRRFDGSFWHPRPNELAEFVRKHKPRLRPPPRRICMVTYSAYLSDSRVKRYAEALAERGDDVDVLALRPSRKTPTEEKVGDHIRLLRIMPRFGKGERSHLSFLLPVLRFCFQSFFRITRQQVGKKPYALLHIHNVPDFLVFVGLLPKLAGAKIILDIHDLVPEFYASKFAARESSAPVRLLNWVERVSAALAHHVIISNHLWLKRYAARTGTHGKCSVLTNNVDTNCFRPGMRTRGDAKPIILFPGGLQWHQGVDIAIRAFERVSAELPDAEFHIYGDGDMKEKLLALTRQLRLEGKVRFFDAVPLSQIARVMANADVGIVPKRANSFGNEAYSTKILEFMALGVPLVVSATKIDRYYFDDSVVRFFESGNPEALAQAVLEVLRDEKLRRRLVANGLVHAARNSWDSLKPDYLRLVDSLTTGDAKRG
jgi:glycosyltransferase involved in cell wall biosynthesis